jgi:hypothetical protein
MARIQPGRNPPIQGFRTAIPTGADGASKSFKWTIFSISSSTK